MMKRALFSIVLGAGAWGAGVAATIESPSRSQLDAYWGSGAEISKFELSQARYGAGHPGHVELIFASEPFLVNEQVKRDFGAGEATPVLKLNALRTFNTGLYSYRTMQSTFAPFDRERFPHALKTTLSVQDWCGQVFLQVNRDDAGWALRSFSYFQSEGDSSLILQDAWLEDDLWLALRQDPNGLPTGAFEAIPSLLYSRFAHNEAQVETAEGSLFVKGELATYRLEYPELGRILEIEFKSAFPYYIQGWTEKDSLGITSARRTHGMGQVEYWRLNQPESAELRGDLGLEEIPD